MGVRLIALVGHPGSSAIAVGTRCLGSLQRLKRWVGIDSLDIHYKTKRKSLACVGDFLLQGMSRKPKN